jgi:hypothetical protein
MRLIAFKSKDKYKDGFIKTEFWNIQDEIADPIVIPA